MITLLVVWFIAAKGRHPVTRQRFLSGHILPGALFGLTIVKAPVFCQVASLFGEVRPEGAFGGRTVKRITGSHGREFFTRERCFITEILNHADSPHMSLARCRVTAGVTTELHRLIATTEVYIIKDGTGEMNDGSERWFSVAPGDSVVIGAGKWQRIRNTGASDLIFEVICTPRFQPPCYEGGDPE